MNIIKADGINAAGFGTIAKSVMIDKRLTVTAKAIYAYFCSFAGAGGSCFPSRDKICYDLNITVNTYTKHLRALIDCGYISVKQERDGGRWARNVYKINLKPCIKKPCTKKSDTEKTVYQNLNTKINNNKNNKDINISSSCQGDGDVQSGDIVFDTLDEAGEENKLNAHGIHGNVMLSELQLMSLSEYLTEDEIEYYIDKLDNFIHEKKARVRNHYMTIKRWVCVDRGVIF